MLDEREQRILADIERQIEGSDPALARLARPKDDRRPYWRSVAVLVVGTLMGVGLAALGPVGHGLLLIAMSAIPMIIWHWRRPGSAHPWPRVFGGEREGRGES
ncbi:DUF3040 domain-containing protein [Actinomycetospora aeridis]|uniref:DUF3040 domain-containing protein n=1 Tax=Actinomycetospora aeridis TaxID=3129231 RepID=A0ABU8N0C5_9PSEU